MSDPRAMAARMTGHRSVDHRDVMGGGTPGLGITGLDVAAALAMGGATDDETLMVMHKWVQDKGVQAPLFYAVYDRIVSLAVEHKWQPTKGAELLRGLTRLAIAEVTDPKCCPECGGRKEVLYPDKCVSQLCRLCKGVGRQWWTDAMRYRILGVCRSTWERVWADKYPLAKAVVDGLDRRGLDAIIAGLWE